MQWIPMAGARSRRCFQTFGAASAIAGAKHSKLPQRIVVVTEHLQDQRFVSLDYCFQS